jgi:hypothetical protein
MRCFMWFADLFAVRSPAGTAVQRYISDQTKNTWQCQAHLQVLNVANSSIYCLMLLQGK